MKITQRIKTFLGFGSNSFTMEGRLPTSWPVNWWQKNYRPFTNDVNSTVNACVDGYAQVMASLPLRHIKINSKGGKDPVLNSAFTKVFRKPNSYQTRSDFILNLIRNLLFNGNGYAYALRNSRNEISELHIMPSRNTTPYIEPESKTIFYGLGTNPLVGELTALIPQRDALHLRLHCPIHPLIGVSPVENCALAISSNNSVLGHQAVFFNNMSRPSGVISTDQILKREQMEQLRKMWSEQSQNLNSGEVPILFGGMKFQQLSLTSQDAQLVEAYHLSVMDIAKAFRVPLPLIGDLRNSTYNNVEQLIATWLATGLGFMLEHVEQALGLFFGIREDEQIQFETKNLLRTDFKGRIDALVHGISGGLYSVNEARAEEGLPAVDFGDEPRLQAQVIPLSSIQIPPSGKVPTASPNGEDDQEDAEVINDEVRQIIAEQRLQNALNKLNSGTVHAQR